MQNGSVYVAGKNHFIENYSVALCASPDFLCVTKKEELTQSYTEKAQSCTEDLINTISLKCFLKNI